MAIPYNPERVNLKKGLVKTAEKRIGQLENPQGHQIRLSGYKRDLKEINRYIEASRSYLVRLKSKCNLLLDESLDDLTCFHDRANNPIADTRFLNDVPSRFLQKAYTEQTFYSDEKDNINRDQPYIDAGKNFVMYCERNKDSLTKDEKLLNDFGTVIAAINGAISQMNRTEHEINSITDNSDNDEYLKIFMNIKPIATFMQILTDEVINEKPHILNSKAGILANAYDDILAMIEKFNAFYNRYFGPRYKKAPSEEKNIEIVEENITSKRII